MVSLTSADVIRYFGPVTDHTVAEVLRGKAKRKDLEVVALLLAQEDDIVGEARKQLSGATARIYDAVTRDPLYQAAEPEEGRGA